MQSISAVELAFSSSSEGCAVYYFLRGEGLGFRDEEWKSLDFRLLRFAIVGGRLQV